MNEGALGMDEKDIRLPDLLHQAAVECAAQIVTGGKSQAFILPIMPQVQGHREVLRQSFTFY